MNRPCFLFFSLLAAMLAFFSCKPEIKTPAQARDYIAPASHPEIREFLELAEQQSPLLTLEFFGQSEGGFDLFVVKASNDKKVPYGEKLRVLLFAQQHGNEQSGKEAALLLIAGIANGKYNHWFDEVELWIVPQMNPDGSEVNQRRNSEGIDLNRDHVVIQSPEVRALHALFHSFKPHVTIDVHEYQPFRPSWEEFGAYKQFDVQVGIITNPNLWQGIRAYSQGVVLPGMEKTMNAAGYSFHNYLVGPVPTEGPTRHSTVDIDDGRQSFGVLGAMAFIYEGINGRDSYADHLQRRAESQALAMKAMIEILKPDREKIIQMVENSRSHLIAGGNDQIAIRMDHFRGENPLLLPLVSSITGIDTVVMIDNYLPDVKPTFSVERPKAYLIPKADSLLMEFVRNHRLEYLVNFSDPVNVIEYHIAELRMSIDEELENFFPVVEKSRFEGSGFERDYLYVPIAQVHSHFLVLTLEPQSQIGLAQYPLFNYFLKENEPFPILRVE
jgi:hypothetical protein